MIAGTQESGGDGATDDLGFKSQLVIGVGLRKVITNCAVRGKNEIIIFCTAISCTAICIYLWR
jgi:hypothetical protein